jgi:signal transduction histidine kinase
MRRRAEVRPQRAPGSGRVRGQRVADTTVDSEGAAQAINAPVRQVSDDLRFLSDAFADVTRVLDRCQGLCNAVQRGSPPSALSPTVIEEAQAAVEEVDLSHLRREIPLAVERALAALKRVAAVVRRVRGLVAPPATAMAPTDLRAVIENTVTIARAEWVKCADVESHVADGLPPLIACAGDLERALLILFERAARAIETVVAKREGARGRICITAGCRGEQVRIVVEDDGAEIPSERCPSLFEEARFDGEANLLAEVSELVRVRHGGRILFESGTGHGTRFHLLLPLTPVVAPAPAAKS